MNDFPKLGCVNHDCDKCKEKQEQFKHDWIGLTNKDIQQLAIDGLFLKDIYIISNVIEAMIRKKNT